MADRSVVEILIPPSPEYVGVARHVIAALVRTADLDPEVAEDVKLAVSEACTNAVSVTARAGSEEPVALRGEVEGGRVHLWVSDRGLPQVPPGGPDRKETDSLDFTFESGLSLPLLEGLVDEIDITERDGGGSVVRMVLSGAPSEATG